MWQIDIGPAHCILLVSIVIALIAVTLSNKKMSPTGLRRAIDEYEALADECNMLISGIGETIDKLRERCFTSESDEEQAVELVKRYQVAYNELLLCNDKIGLYLKKKNWKHYKKYRKRAEDILRLFKETHHSLEKITQNTLSKEEWDYEQRIRNAEQFYKDHRANEHKDYSQTHEKNSQQDTKHESFEDEKRNNGRSYSDYNYNQRTQESFDIFQ